MTISAQDFAFIVDGSDFVPGTNSITFVNDGAQTHHLQFAKGMVAAIAISGDLNEADLPDVDVTVAGVDAGDGSSYGFEAPASVGAGSRTLRFNNNGSER